MIPVLPPRQVVGALSPVRTRTAYCSTAGWCRGLFFLYSSAFFLLCRFSSAGIFSSAVSLADDSVLSYSIEDLTEQSDFLEVSYLLLNGELPNVEEKVRSTDAGNSSLG